MALVDGNGQWVDDSRQRWMKATNMEPTTNKQQVVKGQR